jgi:type VI secretion system protein ImpA
MASPITVDFERLTAPIPGDNSCGADLRWDTVYQAIKDARREGDRDILAASEPLVANWRLVIDTASDCLTARSKDLMIACWLAEALTHVHGFAGLRDGLSLIGQLIHIYWEGLYPLIDEGDLEPRVAPLVWLTDADRGARLPNSLRELPLTVDHDPVCSWNFWKSRQVPPKGENEDDSLFEQRRMLAQQRAEQFEQSVIQTSRAHVENLLQDILQAGAELSRLDGVLDGRFAALAPSASALRNAISECEALVRRMVKDKGGLVGDDPATVDDATGGLDGAPRQSAGPIQSREEAFRRLAEVAAFLRQTEPQSPVSYLIERAVVWGRMPFDQLLGELIKDTSVRGQVGELLGLKAPSSES